MAVTIKGLIKEFLICVKKIVESRHQDNPRPWNLLGFDGDINFKDISEFFNRKALNDLYVQKFIKKPTPGKEKEAVAHLQLEINSIYGTHKSFVCRHRTRLQSYKDDLSQKKLRLPSSLNIARAHAETFTLALQKIS